MIDDRIRSSANMYTYNFLLSLIESNILLEEVEQNIQTYTFLNRI